VPCIHFDLNMVRAGVETHPSKWPFGGYNEIQEPRRKKILINYVRLRQLLGFNIYNNVKDSHKHWVESCLQAGMNISDDKWTRSVAVGSRSFIEKVKSLMGITAIDRKRIETGESYQLREPQIPYGDHLGAEKSHIGLENTYLWN